MNETFNQDELLELLPSFSMGILEPEEMLAIAEALERNPMLQARLAEIDEVTAQLSLAGRSGRFPSPAVKSQLLSRVTAVPTSPATPSPTPRTAPRVQQAGWLERLLGTGWGWGLATAVSLFLFLITAFLLVRQQQTMRQLNSELAQIRDDNTTLQQDLANNEAEMMRLQAQNQELQDALNQENQILAMLANTDQAIALAATDITPGASGAFYRIEDELVLVARGLTAPPPDKQYYLWGVVLGPNDEKDFTNLGPVPLNSDGSTLLSIPIPPGNSDYDVIDVSLEYQSTPPPPILQGDIVLRGLVP